MKITKNLHYDFKELYNDLVKFLAELKYVNANFRMVVFEYDTSNANKKVCYYFDSEKDHIQKEYVMQNFVKDNGCLRYADFFKADEKNIIIETFCNFAPASVFDRKQCFHVMLVFENEVTGLIREFFKRYMHQVLHFFNGRNAIPLKTIMRMRANIFEDTVRQFIDLDLINSLSGVQYEKRDAMGSIVYADKADEVDFKFKFKKEIDFVYSNLRLLRKILEMSDDNKLSLVVCENKLLGVGIKTDFKLKVRFNGNHKWTLKLGLNEKLRFFNGKFFFEWETSRQAAIAISDFIKKEHFDNMKIIIEMLSQQKYGALLIVTDEAEKEASRFSDLARGHAITPVDFSKRENLYLIKSLASVDGAVFLDRNLTCHGVGIILDGIAKKPGSPARGARYNSARCYLDNMPAGKYAGIVFSTDDTIDVLRI
ncbi:MAG: diadenylate cyclase [Firmicutes bacterium]|nr:diadenylate cyclase [Bacillota bacterium]